MLFWLLIFLTAVVFTYVFYLLIVGIVNDPNYLIGAFIAGAVAAFSIVPWGTIWERYSEDYSRVVAQHHRIEVYEERVTSLEERLKAIDYPEKSVVSLDGDHPWSSIIEALTHAESNLATAKDERAKALRSIEQWKRGPFSGVVNLVGDPTRE